MRRKKCRIFVDPKQFVRCDREVTQHVCWHNDGYENKKYVSVCDEHAAQLKSEKVMVRW